MQDKIYTLKSILATFTKCTQTHAKKRLIFDQAPIGGIDRRWLILLFLALPFIEYAGIFNSWMFNMLGLVSAIVFFIVFLSMVMIVVAVLTFINNNKVIRDITPSWNSYFPEVDLVMVLSSGVTPYKDFFLHYGQICNDALNEDELRGSLESLFVQMQEENKDLLELINNHRR